MIFKPHQYQQHALEHVKQLPGSGLFMEMGLGKTVIALTAADYFLNDVLEISKVLVIAPKKVCESVWQQEGQLWNHLKHLRFSLVLGPEKDRIKAINTKADIYVINRENFPWLVAFSQGRWKYDMIIVDESTSFKSHEAKRFKAIEKILPVVKRIIILSGTPMPNSILDIWSQIYLIDKGERLGNNYHKFKQKYFEKEPYKLFSWKLRDENSVKEISEKIKDIVISLHAKDYLDLPERINVVRKVELTVEEKKSYKDFEKDKVLSLASDEEITAINAAALTNKLLQFASGAVYDENKNYHQVHTQKLEHLEEIVEDSNGEPVLVFYSFRHELFRIMERLKKYDPKILESDKQVKAWNKKQIRVLLVHPLSAMYGLNLQAGGNIVVWFSLNWMLEWYQQGNARLDRQGQEVAVIIHHLIATGTMDEEVYKVLQGKGNRQAILMQLVKAKIKKYLKNVA